MRFLVDAKLPRSAVAVLQRFGHHVEFARDIGLAAATDDQIAVHAIDTTLTYVAIDLMGVSVRATQAFSPPLRRRRSNPPPVVRPHSNPLRTPQGYGQSGICREYAILPVPTPKYEAKLERRCNADLIDIHANAKLPSKVHVQRCTQDRIDSPASLISFQNRPSAPMPIALAQRIPSDRAAPFAAVVRDHSNFQATSPTSSPITQSLG